MWPDGPVWTAVAVLLPCVAVVLAPLALFIVAAVVSATHMERHYQAETRRYGRASGGRCL